MCAGLADILGNLRAESRTGTSRRTAVQHRLRPFATALTIVRGDRVPAHGEPRCQQSDDRETQRGLDRDSSFRPLR